MPTVGVRGLRFRYEEAGSGPPLVLVPGTGDDTASLAAAAGLLATTHRVISYDRRGFSDTGGEPPDAKGYVLCHADDLSALIRELGAVPATVVGWSYGGIIALAAAVHHPGAIARLVLFEPPLHAKKHLTLSMARGIGGAVLLGKLRMQRRGTKRFFRWATRHPSGGSVFDDLDPETRDRLLANAPGVIAELAAGTGEELTERELARVKCPVDILVGARTKPMFRDAADRLAKALPSPAALTRIPEGDHVTPMLRPDIFADAVRGALA